MIDMEWEPCNEQGCDNQDLVRVRGYDVDVDGSEDKIKWGDWARGREEG